MADDFLDSVVAGALNQFTASDGALFDKAASCFQQEKYEECLKAWKRLPIKTERCFLFGLLYLQRIT